MNRLFLSALIAAPLWIISCNPGEQQSQNPFFTEYETPFEVPPFDEIEEDDFIPAFKKGIEEQEKEVASIVNNPDEPTFENTIEALENTGALLTRVSRVFYNLLGAHTSDTLQKIAKEISPLLSKSSDDILLNGRLFEKISLVNDKKDGLGLNPEQLRLLEETYKNFARNGANLDDEAKEKLRKINEELSLLSLNFGDNLLAETNDFKLIIEDEKDLSGLPAAVKEAAAEDAKAQGMEGKWIFTLQNASVMPFLQYSDRRELREKIFRAYISRGNNGNEHDNKEIIKQIVRLRIERADILGYNTHADYVLEDNMAKTPEKVYELLNKVWEPALEAAEKERDELQQLIDEEGGNFRLQAWDWRYYAEKLRKRKYDLDENELRPYFSLQNVRKGAFDVAQKLYGLQFVKLNDMPAYHPDVEAFEVKNADGSHVGILYTDYYPRDSKRGGAWMNSMRKQSVKDGEMISPVVVNVGNFSKPTADKPSLLTFDETLTLFHEFGHALHGLLSRCNYESLSGTSVPRDFVELPSQIMENWAKEPEALKNYAKHFETGETIPDEIIAKIRNSDLFNQGFATVEYVAASLLDMNWHTLESAENIDVNEFEKTALDKIGLMQEIVVRYRSPYFNHIFNSGYDAGYYSYLWAERLEADAFEAFQENGIFDQNTAQSFRENILEKGGSEDPMKLYVKFRGKEPGIEPLLERRGFVPVIN